MHAGSQYIQLYAVDTDCKQLSPRASQELSGPKRKRGKRTISLWFSEHYSHRLQPTLAFEVSTAYSSVGSWVSTACIQSLDYCMKLMSTSRTNCEHTVYMLVASATLTASLVFSFKISNAQVLGHDVRWAIVSIAGICLSSLWMDLLIVRCKVLADCAHFAFTM